ncbi:MAG: C40 family peptidase [Actinomycetia bacterium]|nr:C40 family peptidase [Actinomycetes bacterium]MCH9801214.1 C40 family peptidase [Actinomycetes bacterium]
MVATRTRLIVGTAVAAVAGAALVVAPPSSTTAEATSRITVKNKQKAVKVRRDIVKIAKSKVGSRYVLGSTGPSTFDCSGLVVYSFRKATGKTLPRTSYSQKAAVKRVSAAKRKPGDLVFFNGNGHVAIYIGKNKIVHASTSQRGIRVDRISGWYTNTMTGYGRVIQKR